MRVSRLTVLKGGGVLCAGLFVAGCLPGRPGGGTGGTAEEFAKQAQLDDEVVHTTCRYRIVRGS